MKWYIDNIVQIMEGIKTEEISIHVDEAIYSKIAVIMWPFNGKHEHFGSLIG